MYEKSGRFLLNMILYVSSSPTGASLLYPNTTILASTLHVTAVDLGNRINNVHGKFCTV